MGELLVLFGVAIGFVLGWLVRGGVKPSAAKFEVQFGQEVNIDKEKQDGSDPPR